MDEEMKDFVGYHKTRTPPAIPIAMLPAWANTVERSVLLLNTSIVILGVLIGLIVSDFSTPASEGSTIASLLDKC